MAKNSHEQDSIPVRCVLPAFVVPGGMMSLPVWSHVLFSGMMSLPVWSQAPLTVGNVQALGANGKAAFSPKAHG